MFRTFLAATFITIAAFIAGCDSDDDPPPTTTPDRTASANTPAPTASRTTTPPVDAIELTVGDPIPFPEDLALVITTGCWQCDGPTTSIVRLRRTPDGIEQRTLFEPTASTGSISGFAFDAATGRAAVSTCAPNCSGFGEITGTEQTIIHLSTDGGGSFAASPPLDGWFTIAGYDARDLLISGPFDADDEPNPVRTYPGQAMVFNPSNAETAFAVKTGVIWTTRERDRLIAADGTLLFLAQEEQIIEVTPLEATGNRIAVLLFHREDAEAGGSGYRLFMGRRDEGAITQERTLTGGFIHAGAALDDCTIVANADLPAGSIPTPDTDGAGFAGFLPALIDICDGVISPIVDPFTSAPYLNGRNLVTAVQTGPFVSVSNNIGDCLNVRESPSTDALSLGCFAAGVLLRDLEESQDAGGQAWRRVTTPAGDEGWASSEFLVP